MKNTKLIRTVEDQQDQKAIDIKDIHCACLETHVGKVINNELVMSNNLSTSLCTVVLPPNLENNFSKYEQRKHYKLGNTKSWKSGYNKHPPHCRLSNIRVYKHSNKPFHKQKP